MKKSQAVLLFMAIILIYSCSPINITNSSPSEDQLWTHSEAKQHNKNRTDSLTWDMEMLRSDIADEQSDLIPPLPIKVGAFPVPHYDLLGEESFKGLINGGRHKTIENKNLIFSAFSIKRNALNKTELEKRNDEVFFTIITLTDTIDTQNYNLTGSIISSRNHPNYIGEGFIKTKDNRVDYVAFKTIENKSYAVINMSLFDLNFGNTILVAPQKDKSFRFLQIDLGKNQMQDLEKEIDTFLGTKRASTFFLKPGNI